MPKWLNCIVTKGMFSDEFTVTVKTRDGGQFAVFVPRDAADESAGRVKVQASEQSGKAIAILPDEQQSVVEVASSDLVPA
ncbi:MAG: hypothetical protein NTW19_22050 [Planctomycetota bacterium]|nr:hypothetical protein [Planctomycetota bacterium]